MRAASALHRSESVAGGLSRLRRSHRLSRSAPRAPTTREESMDKLAIASQIKEFLETEFAGQGTELTETTNLIEDFFLDSFGIINTVMFLESAFSIEIDRADINASNFECIATLTEFVAQRVAA